MPIGFQGAWAIRMLSKELDDIEIVMADSTQSECMAFIESSVRKVLDKFTPLHTEAFVEKRSTER